MRSRQQHGGKSSVSRCTDRKIVASGSLNFSDGVVRERRPQFYGQCDVL